VHVDLTILCSRERKKEESEAPIPFPIIKRAIGYYDAFYYKINKTKGRKRMEKSRERAAQEYKRDTSMLENLPVDSRQLESVELILCHWMLGYGFA